MYASGQRCIFAFWHRAILPTVRWARHRGIVVMNTTHFDGQWTRKVIEWLGRHPRFTFHFTPTSASWLNAVEGFFAILFKRRLKRGVFKSIVDLQAAINRFLVDHNLNPKPFVWTKDPEEIIAAVKRGHQVLDSIH